jgi:catechol 2,3-dioxygenase-like lactoylglutathione lyase family enzyme
VPVFRMDDVEVHASPVLPVTDLDRALAHYARLGFRTSRHDDTYGYAAWAGLELHLAVDPDGGGAEVYLHVPDADAVAEAWSGPGTTDPTDKPWHVHEGSHVDPDGNLLRFGSPLASGT